MPNGTLRFAEIELNRQGDFIATVSGINVIFGHLFQDGSILDSSWISGFQKNHIQFSSRTIYSLHLSPW